MAAPCQSRVMRVGPAPAPGANIRLSARKSPWQRVFWPLAMSAHHRFNEGRHALADPAQLRRGAARRGTGRNAGKAAAWRTPVPTQGPSPKGRMVDRRQGSASSGRFHQFACRRGDLVDGQAGVFKAQAGDAGCRRRRGPSVLHHQDELVGFAGRTRRRRRAGCAGPRWRRCRGRTALRAHRSTSRGRRPRISGTEECRSTIECVAGPMSSCARRIAQPQAMDVGRGADALGHALGVDRQEI